MTVKPVPGPWGRIWGWWLAFFALSFAILETIALIDRSTEDTLSENTRRWLGTNKTWKTGGALAFIVALVGFVIWFIPHIVFNWG